MKTKLNELLEFPTPFAYKVIGQALPGLAGQVVKVVQYRAPGDYTPTVELSSKGNYHSVSVTINATHIEQIETLYEELGKIDIVHMALQLASPLSGSQSGNSPFLAVIHFSPTFTHSPWRCCFVSG